MSVLSLISCTDTSCDDLVLLSVGGAQQKEAGGSEAVGDSAKLGIALLDGDAAAGDVARRLREHAQDRLTTFGFEDAAIGIDGGQQLDDDLLARMRVGARNAKR